MSRPPKLCQPGLHTSASTSHTEVYLVSNVSLPKSSTIIWEWKGWSPTTHLPPYFTEFLIDFGGGKYSALPGDRVHVLGFRFRDIDEFVDSIGHLPGFKDVGRLSLEQLFFDKYPSMASLSKAFGDPRLGKIKELTFQLFHGAAVVFPTPVLITLLAHCKHLEHIHFRGCGLSHGNSNRLRDSEVWQHWLSLSRGKPYAVAEARSIETISFEDVDSQHMEDVLVFVAASDSPFDLGGLRCLSIPSLTILEPPSAGTTSLCSILKQILITAREHLEVLQLSFPLRDDMIPLPRLCTLGLYIRKRAQYGTELLRWGGRILANETVAPSIEIGFASASMRWCWRDELQQNHEADMDLLKLAKRRHAVGQGIPEELSDLFSSFDDLDEILAARVAQGAVTNLRIIGPSRDNSGLDWNEVLRGALFPRSMDKFELCRISPSVYC